MEPKVKKKFPVVLLCITLVLVLLVTSFVNPGFVLPLLERRLPNENLTAEEEFPDAGGKSKAFSVTPLEGITISAEENALDKDRKFKMEELPDTKLQEYQAAGRAGGIDENLFVIHGWELDAGLQDDEEFPGTYHVEIDLAQQGFIPEFYDGLQIYRVDGSGTWTQIASQVENGILSYDCGKNSSILAAIGIGLLLGLPIYDMIQDAGSGIGDFDGTVFTVKVRVDGKHRYNIRSDLTETKAMLGETFKQKQQEIAKKAEERARKFFRREHGEPEVWNYGHHKAYESLLKESIETLASEDPYFQKLKTQNQSELKQFLKKDLATVELVTGYLKDVYYFQKTKLKVEQPWWTTTIEFKHTLEHPGVTSATVLFNPTVLVRTAAVGSKKGQDDLFLTLAHELFHVIQRGYVNNVRHGAVFDEMYAQAVEVIAYDYFADQGKITSPRTFQNMTNTESDLCIPLNDIKTTYPEGEYDPGDWTFASYAKAPFMLYLLEKNPYLSHHTILMRYKLSAIMTPNNLLKVCFRMSEEQLTEAFHDFAVSYQQNLKAQAKNAIFAPIAPVGGDVLTVPVVNKHYTLRVRRVQVQKPTPQTEKFSLVLFLNDHFKSAMSDMQITPIGMEKYADYREWEKGLAFEPLGFPDETVEGVDMTSVYLLEADGGTASATRFYNSTPSYQLMALYQPEQPNITLKEQTASFSFPPLRGAGTKGGWFSSGTPEILDSYVMSIRLNKELLGRWQILRKDMEKPWELDLTTLRYKGEPLTQEQINACECVIQECVAGTYEKDEVLGPESTPMKLSDEVDLCGEWTLTSKLESYGMGWADDLVGMMPDELQEYKDFYNQVMGSTVGTEGHGTMLIEQGTGSSYQVTMTFDGEEPTSFRYNGVWDPASMLLTLTTDDAAQVVKSMELHIKKEADGGLSFTGETAADTYIVNFKATYSGVKKQKTPDPT